MAAATAAGRNDDFSLVAQQFAKYRGPDQRHVARQQEKARGAHARGAGLHRGEHALGIALVDQQFDLGPAGDQPGDLFRIAAGHDDHAVAGSGHGLQSPEQQGLAANQRLHFKNPGPAGAAGGQQDAVNRRGHRSPATDHGQDRCRGFPRP